MSDTTGEAIELLKKRIVEQLARMRDAYDREGFLSEIYTLANELWDNRADYDAKTH